MYTIEEFDKTKTKILKYVLYKKRTEREIRRKFEPTVEAELLDDVIDNLKEIGYVNDTKYLERAIAEYMALRNLSMKEIRYKLYTKGLSNDIIDTYFENNAEQLEEYEIQSAKNIIFKKQNNIEEEELTQYLLKKGYSLESIRTAIMEK